MSNSVTNINAQEKPAENPLLGSETILLVEDEPMVRNMVSELLRSRGFTVIESANGIEALEIAKSYAGKSINLMISDISMPGMDGQQLALRLKELRPDTKVLFTSGYDYADCNFSEPAHALGAFLQKPYTVDKLFGMVRQTLDS